MSLPYKYAEYIKLAELSPSEKELLPREIVLLVRVLSYLFVILLFLHFDIEDMIVSIPGHGLLTQRRLCCFCFILGKRAFLFFLWLL